MWKQCFDVRLLSLFCLMMNIYTSLAFDANSVTSMLKTSLDCHNNPGLAVAVVKDDQILYSKGFGVTDLETKENVTDETLFGIASISKSFGAALLVKLLNEKTNLTLDSKVRELFKDDFIMPDELRTKETTFLDMLSHKTAILPNNRIRFDNNLTRATLLSRLRYLPTERQFRVDYLYNNLIYGLIAVTAEKLGGKSWEDLVTEHLFKPLKMNKSTFATKIDYSRNDLAKGYMDRKSPGDFEKVTPEFSRLWSDSAIASGSVFSSVKDMIKWMKFHLSKGQNENNQQVMDSKLVEELHEGRYKISKAKYKDIEMPQYPITSIADRYALGLRTGYYRSYPYISHSGTTFGYASYMSLLPTQNIGVIVLLTGREQFFRHRVALMHFLLDSALGVKPYLNSSTICTFPNPWLNKELKFSFQPPPSNVSMVFPTKEYEGMYSQRAYGDVKVVYNASLKSLVMSYGWADWQLMVGEQSDDEKEQRIFGKGIPPISATDMTKLHFIPHPKNDKIIVGLRATSFETRRPPIFCKHEYKKVCEEIVSKTYPMPKREKECEPNSAIPAVSKLHNYGLVLVSLVAIINNKILTIN